jgi:hypothetical protein
VRSRTRPAGKLLNQVKPPVVNAAVAQLPDTKNSYSAPASFTTRLHLLLYWYTSSRPDPFFRIIVQAAPRRIGQYCPYNPSRPPKR